jgi:hypothetical protein
MSLAGRPRIVFFGPPGAGKTTLAAAFRDRGVDPVDTDGAADAALLLHSTRLESDDVETPVAAADALVVAIDAGAPAADVDRMFGDVRRFLDAFETGRTRGRAVAGLPVFLTLTKCDTVPDPAVVADRLRTRFHEYLADGPDGFGTIDVRVGTTGLPVDGRFVGAVTDAGKEFRTRAASSARRLTATTSAAGTALALLATGIGAFFATDTYGPDDPLVARVHAFQAKEGPPAVRFGDAWLARNRKELRGIAESSGFDRLPDELRGYVHDRLEEYDAYSTYRALFNPPRLGPGDVRTAAELDRLDADLRSTLLPPPEYAGGWAETDAVRLRDTWQADTAAVRTAEARIHDWYRGLTRRATGLVLADPFDPAWKADGDALLRDAATTPAKPADLLPGSSLAYAVPLDFARIDFDRRDWEDAKARLLNLREAVAAVSPGGVLDLPGPTGDTAASLALGTARLNKLPPADLAADRFSDPAKEELRKRYLRARETGLRHVREAVRSKLRSDTPLGWKALTSFVNEPAFRDWEQLLGRLAAFAGEHDTGSLAAFLRRDSFPVGVRDLEIAIPNDLSTQRLTPGPTLTLRRTPTTGEATVYRMKRVGEPTRRDGEIVAKYVPDDWGGELTLAPGVSLTASLPISADGPEVRLVWDSSRTKTFAFESLSRPAAVVQATGPRSPATGVRVTVGPADGLPVVPATIPDVSGGK